MLAGQLLERIVSIRPAAVLSPVSPAVHLSPGYVPAKYNEQAQATAQHWLQWQNYKVALAHLDQSIADSSDSHCQHSQYHLGSGRRCVTT
jgi:hypothetical protein